MDIEAFPPYSDGKPVGFVYQEPNHPPSYQVIRGPKGDRAIQTSDIDEIAKAAKAVPGIVWLSREQIDSLKIPSGKEGMRPLNEDEELKLAA